MLRDLKRNEVTAGTQCEPNQTLPVQLSSTDCSLASSKCRRPGNGKQVSELTPLRFNLRRKTHLREADEHRLAAFGRRFLSQQRLLWKCLSTSATCHCNRRYLTDAPLFKGRITFVRLMTPAAHADRSRYSSQDLSGFFFFFTRQSMLTHGYVTGLFTASVHMNSVCTGWRVCCVKPVSHDWKLSRGRFEIYPVVWSSQPLVKNIPEVTHHKCLKQWSPASTVTVPPPTSPPKNRNNYVYVARDTYKCECYCCLQKR